MTGFGKSTTLLLLATSMASGGCGILPSETVCKTIAIPAIRARIYDAVTREPAAENAMLVVRDGAYVDSASTRIPGALEITAASERAGTYDVLVRKDGYVDWELRAVTVSHDECHVKTKTLTVMLERS